MLITWLFMQGGFRTHHWRRTCLQSGLPIHGSSKDDVAHTSVVQYFDEED